MKVFPPFRLDAENQCLWREAERVALTPKAFCVLNYLVDRAGKLVGQSELLDALWAEKFVQPEVLKTHILEIRNALGDDAKNPRYIETQPRRGYRFVAQVSEDATAAVPPAEASSAPKFVKRIWLAWTAAGLILTATLTGFILRSRHENPPAPVVRFEIPLPEHVTLPYNPRFAVSPDGKHLVFRAQDSDGVLRLWVRDLDSLESRVLEGTETADGRIQPAWSPDSRYIAFHADGKIKKIAVTGGPAMVVCDVPGGLPTGIAWSTGGQVVFGTGSEGVGIMRAPAGGGTAQALTELDRARGEYIHAFPVMLPDGEHFLYARGSHIASNTGVYVGSLNAAPKEQGLRRIPDLPGLSSAPVYVTGQNGSGYILYRKAGTILARPFDYKRLEFNGQWLPVAEMAKIETAQPGFSVSANGVLVHETRASFGAVQPTWFDRRGNPLGTVSEKGEYTALSIAPDGKRVVVRENSDLWLVDPAHTARIRLTFRAEGEDVTRAIWSPDGDRIAFGASYGHRDYLEPYEKPLTGADAVRLVQTTGAESQWPTDWSHDGRFLLLNHLKRDGSDDLWALSRSDQHSGDGKPFVVLRSPFNLQHGVFSRDAKWIAYTSDESGKDEVYVRRFSPQKAAEAAPGGGQLISNNGGADIRWPRDSNELFYLTSEGKIMAVSVTPGPEFRAGVPEAAFAGKVEPGLWDVSADGKRLLIGVPAQSSQAPFTVVLNWQAALARN